MPLILSQKKSCDQIIVFNIDFMVYNKVIINGNSCNINVNIYCKEYKIYFNIHVDDIDKDMHTQEDVILKVLEVNKHHNCFLDVDCLEYIKR